MSAQVEAVKKRIPVSTFRTVDSRTEWNKALRLLADAHVLQSWEWGEFKSRWGWTATRLVLDHPGQADVPLASALVLKRKLPHLPLSILYVPKGPSLDYRDAALRRVVLAELEQHARRERAIFMKIDPEVVRSWGLEDERRSPIGRKFVEELAQRGWQLSAEQVQFRNTVELALQRPEEELLGEMKSKTRYNIRLASRKGIEVRLGTAKDFVAIADMYAETAARDGFAVRPKAYYLDAWKTFYESNIAQPFVAEYEGEAIAAVIVVCFGTRTIYMYGASSGRERNRMPNHLLQWEAMRWARNEGYETYDFWGAPDAFEEFDPLWGVWRFKEGFRGQVVRHIGAWDYPVRPFWYWIYSVAIPKYLNLLRSRQASLADG